MSVAARMADFDATQARARRTRGTSNGNDSGSAEDRRRRRAWLIETYRADRDLLIVTDGPAGPWWQPVMRGADVTLWVLPEEVEFARIHPACRCYRCGVLLIDTDDLADPKRLTVDRIVPGCLGGTYRRTNIRPACNACNMETGGRLGGQRAGKRRRRG